MTIHFNADEVFQMAEEIERNGAKFYRQVARQFDDDEIRKMALELANMEDMHLERFKDMRATLAQGAIEETVYDPTGEVEGYLRSMADTHVFDIRKDPSSVLTGEESLTEVLKFAVGIEKNSIAFYVGMKELISSKKDKEEIDRIIREEMGHVTKICSYISGSCG